MPELINEQEQVDWLKQHWNRYGYWLVALVLLVLLGLLGWRFFENRQQKIALDAAASYQQLLVYVEDHQAQNLEATARQLMANYPHTIYGSLAGLLLAGEQVQEDHLPDAAETLRWVLKQTNDAPTRAIAQVRLARVLLSEKQPQAALQVLSGVSENFLSEMVRGDCYEALGQGAAAQKAYQNALRYLKQDDPWYPVVQMKLANLPS